MTSTPSIPLPEALLAALQPVEHCGDYGFLWVNEQDRLIHLTMGDCDGEDDPLNSPSGVATTPFATIAQIIQEVVSPYWPGWTAPTEDELLEETGSLVIAAEWDPQDEDGEPPEEWSWYGRFGTTV